MMPRRYLFNFLTILAVALAGPLFPSAMADEQAAAAPEAVEVSIWDDIESLDFAPSANGLQTAPTDATQEPILVPLPAPLIAAGTGLGLAWLVRRRLSRS